MERLCIGHHMNCQDPGRPRERERIRKIYWTSREPIVLDDFWSRPQDPGGSAQKPPMGGLISTSIIGLVVEFVVAIDEARVRFTDDALLFFFFLFTIYCYYVIFYTLQLLTKSGNNLIPGYIQDIYHSKHQVHKYTSTQLTIIMIMINSKLEYIPHIQH
ncbi:hypothetical protein N7465_005955 [Penicillium sp. CMV-2018d]|nr:hypothetical protein N7465_005955 [Penicillium sp. CMV-2018d]